MNHRALSVGERIELRRRRMGLSRRVVAQLIGRSEEWLRQVERGHTQLDSIQVLVRLGEVLHAVDPTELIGWSSAGASAAREVGLELGPLNRAIMDHPSMRSLSPETSSVPVSLESVHDSLEECWTVWLDSDHRYTELAARLPGVLGAARAIRAAAQLVADGPVEEAGNVLIDAYHLARLLLTRVGDYHLAWLVADRPIGILAHSTKPALAARSSWHVASALLSLGYHAECRDYALAAGRRLAAEPFPDQNLDGALRLVAAEGAAGVGDSTGFEELLAEAERIAARLDLAAADPRLWFGRTEVAITAMSIAVRQGRVDDAVEIAAAVDVPDSARVDLRVLYYLTTAEAYSLRGEDFAAVFALQQAERACPEDIRYDWVAHRTLQRSARRNNHLIRRDLARLLDAAGLA